MEKSIYDIELQHIIFSKACNYQAWSRPQTRVSSPEHDLAWQLPASTGRDRPIAEARRHS